MSAPPAHEKDPFGWCVAIALAFAALAAIRLGIPARLYFDEIHYHPAALGILRADQWLNREHPMLGKEIIALGIALLGDNPMGWRVPSLVAGTVALFAGMRAMWFASARRFATLAYGLLLATGFFLFIHSRIAMLDIFMIVFVAIGLWQCAAAVREPERGRLRLAVAGISLGLAMGAKWNAAIAAAVPGAAFLALRLHSSGWRFLHSRRGAPLPGMTLLEAGVWLGLVPIAVYALTFLPACWIAGSTLPDEGLIAEHARMLSMQAQVVKPHNYMSRWPEWVTNWRAIWYLYDNDDGVQRGILTIGNPLTMLLGLPALAWCAWAAATRNRSDALAVFLFYAVTLGFWIVASKPVQFLYHYFLPSCFLLAALALALDDVWTRGRRWLAGGVLAASAVMFAIFYPILSAAPLEGRKSYEHWMWLRSWR